MLNIRKRFFLLLTIIGLMFVVTSCVTSTDYVKVSFDSGTYEVKVGQTLDIKPLISKGTSVGEISVEYSSSDQSIATYDDGKLTGITTGQVVIKVVCVEKPVAYDTATVNVVEDYLPEVQFGQLPETILKGESVALTYEFIPSYANANVKFESANTDIATVDENGVITGVGLGTAIICVRVSDLNNDYRDYNFSITVRPSDFSISYELDGGTNHSDNKTSYNALKLPITLLEPTKEGYEFLGWYNGETLVKTIEKGTEEDLTLVAKWELAQYKLSFDFAGGNNGIDTYTTREEMVEDFLSDAMKLYSVTDKPTDMITFATKFSAITKIFTDKTTSEKWGWLRTYIIEVTSIEATKESLEKNTEAFWRYSIGAFLFKECRASWPKSEDFTKDENANGFWNLLLGIVEPTYTMESEEILIDQEAFRAGYKFLGWYIGDEKVEKVPTGTIGNTKVVAKWEVVTYKLELDYGKSVFEGLPTEFEYNVETGLILPVPTYKDWIFVGWFDSEKKFENVLPGTVGDLKLHARWCDPSAEYEIDYKLDGGKLPDGAANTFIVKDGIEELSTPTKLGYKFIGWFTDENLTVEFDGIKANTAEEGITVYASWEIITYKLSYELNGGEFQKDSVAPLYDTFEDLANEFVSDYAKFTKLSDITVDNFYSKSNQLGVYTFFKNEEMSAKWSWVLDFIYQEAVNTNYSNKVYLKLTAGVANFNKYMRANLSAFLQQTCSNNTNVRTIDFTNVDSEALWSVCPTKEIKVGVESKDSYTVLDLPLELATPFKDGVSFVCWSTTNKYRDSVMTLVEGTTGDLNFYAKWEGMEAIYDKFNVNYNLNGGRIEGEYSTTYIETEGLETLPIPTKVGYTFLGWTRSVDSTEYVTSISTEEIGDVTLYANWVEKEPSTPKLIYVGADREYKTLEEALAVANKGDTIVLDAGTYEGGTIKKSITIKGPNTNVNPNTQERKEEAYIIGDLTIESDNVTINGIALTGKGRINVNVNENVNNISISYVKVKESTVNNTSSTSETAPFDFNVNTGYTVSNVTLMYSRIESSNSAGREMIMFATNINNLTITDNQFFGNYQNYNDGLKLGYNAAVGVTGNLVIKNNKFQDYQQYVIWLHHFGNINVELSSNTFEHIGVTKGSHAAISFITYTGSKTDTVSLNMTYNTVSEGLMLLRVDKNSNLTADNGLFIAKYNALVNSSDTVFVKNSSNAVVKCDYNYWGSTTVTEDAFVGTTHTNDCGSQDTVPTKETNFLEGKLLVGEGQTYKTIKEALAAAKEGDSIYLTAGTYAEELEITIDNLTIYGPNYDVNGNATRKEEAILTLPIKISSNGVTLNGIRLNNGSNILVAGNNTVLTNIYSVASASGKPSGGNRNGVVWTDSSISELLISNSYFNIGTTSYTKSVFVAYEKATNVTLKNNILTHESTSQSSISEAVVIAQPSGIINILENEIVWITDNWSLMLGGSGMSVTEINILNNKIDGRTVDDEEYYTCGFQLHNLPKDAVLNIIHNDYGYLGGTTLDTRYSKAGSEINVKYNALNNTKWKINYTGDGKYTYEGNYYAKAQTTVTTDYGVVTSKAKADELYEIYQIIESMDSSEVYSNLSYELNGGTIQEGYDVKYLEGQKVDLYTASKEGHKFLGWSLDVEGTKTYKQIQKDWTGDIKLYAQWIEIFNLEYVANGGETEEEFVTSAVNGTVIKLPTLDKYGHVFLGWTLTEESTDYLSEITLTGNVKLYAQFVEATFYYVTFELNGGSILYGSRDELVADLLNDYNKLTGHSYAEVSQVSEKPFEDIDWHTFMDSDTKLANGQTPREKWLWLAEYIYDISKVDLASNNCNVLGLKALINGNSYTGDAIYGISYAFRAFIKGTTIRPNSSYTSVDFSNQEKANGFWEQLSASELKEYKYYQEQVTLPSANLENYQFDGWYTNAEFTGEAVKVVTPELVGDGLKLYAKFVEANPVSSITIDNKVTEIKRFETLQLKWTINPNNANITAVKFTSSNPEVATINDKGLITAVSNGTTTITIISQSISKANDSFVLEVYSPDHFNASYDTNSYLAVDENIKLLAEFVKRGDIKLGVTWTSLNPEIATVDEFGVVTGSAEGVATIRATAEGTEQYFDFVVTVVSKDVSATLQQVLDSHESNVFVRYDLGIGSGTPAYYTDIFGSVSRILYNHKLEINTQYYQAGNDTKDYYENSTKNEGLEFITVHYTAGFDSSADTDNHASYFTSGKAGVSIHYITGNAGNGDNSNGVQSEVFSTLSHDHGAYHAGDSNSRYYSNSDKTNDSGEKVFNWMATGVKAPEGTTADDLVKIKWTASDDFYYEINGQKTLIKLPATYDYKERGTTHTYNSDGTISSTSTFNSQFSWAKIENQPVENFFNDQGFPVTIINGEYYMGPTWWSYGQVVQGRICGSGGNRNSIGIESCCNNGSDLWYTWQVTAKLVAQLMLENDLDISRVKGHHFFDGKDCPQPMLENDLEIWWEFLELVKAEYELLTTFKESTFEFEVDEKFSSFISSNGRVIAQPEYSQVVTYTVTVKTGDSVETITLGSAVTGIYNR